MKISMFFKRKIIVLLSAKNIGSSLTSALVLPQWISQDCSSIKNYRRIMRYHMPEEAYSALSLEELGNGRAPFTLVLPEVQSFSVFVQNGDLSRGLLLHIHTSEYVCVSHTHTFLCISLKLWRQDFWNHVLSSHVNRAWHNKTLASARVAWHYHNSISDDNKVLRHLQGLGAPPFVLFSHLYRAWDCHQCQVVTYCQVSTKTCFADRMTLFLWLQHIKRLI